jgi:hypothetical protein
MPPENTGPVPANRWILSCFGLAGLALAAFGYCFDRTAYFNILRVVMVQPFHIPFIDALFIPAMVDCWNHGINVYVTAPCDPLQRTFAYSPLWLRARYFTAWSSWMGIALDSTLFISLAMLPQPRRPSSIAYMVLALFSSMSVFALERGNIDVVMFLLIITGGWCWMRGLAFRLAGYALFAFAGLLKFYPLVLFMLFIRERIALFFGLCIAGLALIAGFVWYFQRELHEMARNLPVFSSFVDAFGARQLPTGLETALPYLMKAVGIRETFLLSLPVSGFFSLVVWAVLTAAAISFGLRLAARSDVRTAFNTLAADERCFLLIGAALFCGCFFVVENGGYRGIHFLFVIPGLLALAEAPGLGRIFRITAGAVIFVMWGLTMQMVVAALSGGQAFPMSNSVAIYLYWIIHELAWWWIISVLLAILFCFIGQSPVWRLLTGRERPA